MPTWLNILAWLSLLIAGGGALVVADDIVIRRPQKIWIMNLVWPITMLYSGPIGLWAYFHIGREHHHYGFATSFPINIWLIKNEMKEAM